MLINSSSMSPNGRSLFNRLTQKLFLCFFVSLSFFELQADSPKYSAEILNVNDSNNRIDILADPEKRKNQSNVKQSEDTFAAEKLSTSSEGQGLLDYGQALNIPFTYPYP